MGGTFAAAPEPARRVLRAIDIQTGKVAWELPQFGTVDSWGGVLARPATSCSSATTAARWRRPMPKSGKRLWSFQTSQVWKASPMTYVFDNRQLRGRLRRGRTSWRFGVPTP